MTHFVDYQAVADIFEAMRTETVDGMSVAEMVGGGFPMPVAVHFMDLLAREAGLSGSDRILDVGCGCGRLAAALTRHLGPDGSYRGVDIVAGLVDFARRHITPRHPGFSFVTLERDNPAYDQWRHEGSAPVIASLAEAAAPGSIDLCIATSLFTHLDSAMARETLSAIATALHPDGRLFATLFLLDSGTRALIDGGRAAFQFEHPYGEGAFVQDPRGDAPLGALAFTHAHFVALLAEQGLYVERVLYGGWAGRPHFVSGQDVMVVRKRPPSVSDAAQAPAEPAPARDSLEQLAAENRRLLAEVEALHRSRSWRITAPVRALSRALRG